MEHWTIDDFTDQLADKAPVPGGGGASALAGALGAALGHMGAALTMGKKRYASYEQTLERHMQQLEAYRQTLQTGIQHDANAFLKLREAYSLPAQTQRERQNRTDAIQRALRVAVQPPMDTLDNGVKVAQSLHELRPITSKQVLSDIGCAAAMCRACMEAAFLNVIINTAFMTDRNEAAALERRAREMSEKGIFICAQVYEAVKQSLCNSD